ncbi:hypothetical protein [Paramagnetospirillum marisnigri]|uniref:hypothetical protein n=1 Tax=Paramagnetospirillum marisnigri TaxID=1285242 RepID=UPI0012E97E34|nr:hypothetical protein [Paramagnetospirillum marisnigri]
MKRITRNATALVAMLAVLGACGTPGPGMLFDAASKEYKSRETAQLNSRVSAFLSKKSSTNSLRGIITFNQGVVTGYLRKYMIIISGRSASQEDINYIKDELPTFLEIERDRCEFKIDIDFVNG